MNCTRCGWWVGCNLTYQRRPGDRRIHKVFVIARHLNPDTGVLCVA